MWPFRRPSRPSREMERAFGKYLSADALRQLADNLSGLQPLASARIDFILIALADDLWQGPQAELDAAIRLLSHNGAIIETIMPPLIKAVFGLPLGAGEAAGHRPMAEMAAALLAELGAHAKLVYGSVDCRHGFLGTPSRFCYGTQIVGFDRIIGTLLALDFGALRAV